MVTFDDYGTFETAWCPGCGNHSILKSVKQALVALELEPSQVLVVSGIGQAAKAPHYLRANVFNGLHGRALPVATGAKLSNPGLTVVVESGEGCMYGEGGNHLLAAIRRNIDVTAIVHNNQVYGLTKGQASPTSSEGFVTKVQPRGVFSSPFNPIAVAVAMQAGFVARGYAGEPELLSELIRQGIEHRGFSLIDVLQPCVSFNKVNTYAWYKERCRSLPEDYDPTDRVEAMRTADEWDEGIPMGVIYRNDRPAFDDHFPPASEGPLAARGVDVAALRIIMESYL